MHNWAQALNVAVIANNSSHLGYNDWRLPNQRELLSIAETCGFNPAINQAIFPNTPAAYFWSASHIVVDAGISNFGAWVVHFSLGISYGDYEVYGYPVRLVRVGRSVDVFDLLKISSMILTANPPSPASYGQPVRLTATVTGNNPTGSVSFKENGTALTCDSANQSLDASGQATCVLNSLNAGSYNFTAEYAGDANNNPSSSSALAYVVNKADQVITGLASNPAMGTYDGTATLSATASSGLAVSFGSNTPSVCTVSGSTVSFIAVGTCTVTADQAGNANYNAAPQVILNIPVNKAGQTISNFTANPASGVVGGTSTLSDTASSGLPVSFGSSTPAVCTVSGNTVTFVAGGTCTVTADQAGNANYNPAPQVMLDIVVSAAPVTEPRAVPGLGVWSLAWLRVWSGGVTVVFDVAAGWPGEIQEGGPGLSGISPMLHSGDRSGEIRKIPTN